MRSYIRSTMLAATALAALSMPDESGAGDDGEGEAAAATNSKRKSVSKRSYLGTDGSEADRIEEATGARYTLLGGADGNIDFDMQFGEAGKLETMCAIFGFHTKVGNVANTVLNDKNDPGSPDEAAEAIREFLTGAQAGTWAERTGGVAVKIDKDALAGAVVEAFEAKGKTVEYSKVRELLENPVKVRQYRQVPEIAEAYNRKVGKAPKTLDDIGSDFV